MFCYTSGEEHNRGSGAGLLPGPHHQDLGRRREVSRGGALLGPAQHRVQGGQGPQMQHRYSCNLNYMVTRFILNVASEKPRTLLLNMS